MHWNNIRVLTNCNRERYEASFSFEIESGTCQNPKLNSIFVQPIKIGPMKFFWYHFKQSFRRKSEDIRRPLIPGENIDEVYRQKERERKRKKLEEKKPKIVPGRASKKKRWQRRHRYWWRMLETKWDNFEMLVTVLAIFVTNILYILTLVGYQHPKDVTNIEVLSLTSVNCHQDKVAKIHLSPTSM